MHKQTTNNNNDGTARIMEHATAAADAARTDDASVIYEAFEFQDASETMHQDGHDEDDTGHADHSTATRTNVITGHDALSRLNSSLPDPFASSSSSSSHSSDAAATPPAGLAYASTRSPSASHAPYSSGEVSSNLSRRGHHASSSDPFMISSHEGREGQAQGHGGGSHNNSAAGSVLVDGPARHAAAEPPESIMFHTNMQAQLDSSDQLHSPDAFPTSRPSPLRQPQDSSTHPSVKGARRTEPKLHWWDRDRKLTDPARDSIDKLHSSASSEPSQHIKHGRRTERDSRRPRANTGNAYRPVPTETAGTSLPTYRTDNAEFDTGRSNGATMPWLSLFSFSHFGLPTFGFGHSGVRLQSHSSAREQALWMWLNAADLDGFLQEVYTYYVRKGYWAIVTGYVLDLGTVAFVFLFTFFLLRCVDYSVVKANHHLSDVVNPQCISGLHGWTLSLFLICSGVYTSRVYRFGQEIRKLKRMQSFYSHLLDIQEPDIQTVSWSTIVEKLGSLRQNHPADTDMAEDGTFDRTAPQDNPLRDAHDIANRIMRKDNYIIALFNKNVLDIRLPRPRTFTKTTGYGLLLSLILGGEDDLDSETLWLSRTLEWSLDRCVLGFFFGPDGRIRSEVLSQRESKSLANSLRHRLILMGSLHAVLAPFVILYLLFYSFFRYFEEYHKNPASLGMRNYTQLARWKFREFNELPHNFNQRLNRSHPLAEAYLNQFPNVRTAQFARFVAFVSGSFASVLVLFSLADPDAFLHFEITRDRTVLFYIGLFGTIMAVSRGMVPDPHRVVEPEQLLSAVIEETHYLPAEWRGRLHSAYAHQQFSKLFPLKVVIFLHELGSVLTTPLILWFSMPKCALQIVEFFRDFTVHVDGVGHVCSFAVFDFGRHGDPKFGAPLQGEFDLQSEQGKLEKSVLTFKAAHAQWTPQDPVTSLYLDRMNALDKVSNPYMHDAPSSWRRDSLGKSSQPDRRSGAERGLGFTATSSAQSPVSPQEKDASRRGRRAVPKGRASSDDG